MKELIKIQEEYGDQFCEDFIQIAEKYTREKYDFIYLNMDKLIMYHKFTNVIRDCS